MWTFLQDCCSSSLFLPCVGHPDSLLLRTPHKNSDNSEKSTNCRSGHHILGDLGPQRQGILSKLYLYFSQERNSKAFFLPKKMSFEDKRFCFSCKLDVKQLLNQKKTLKTCTNCQIAQYCGIECQRKEYPSHKQWCILFVKRQRKVMDKAKKILEEKGHDLNRSSLKEFYDENDGISQCIQKQPEFIYEGIQSSPLERGVIINLGQVFHTYNNSNMNIVKSLGKCRFGVHK